MSVHPARRLWRYLQLIHPGPVATVMLATALFGLLAARLRPEPLPYALLLAGALGGQIAIGALNEYVDRHDDALVKPWKPIPAGVISAQAALRLAALGLLLMTVAGALLGPAALLVLLILTGSGLAYDLWLKRTRWSWLPYVLALPLLPSWVWLALGHPAPRLLLLYPLGAPLVVAVHLAQSLGDAERDRVSGTDTLVARLGRRAALHLLLVADLTANLEIALVGIWLAVRPAPVLGVAMLGIILVPATLAVDHRAPRLVDRYLFQLLALLAVALGTAWVVAVGV